jgi:UDP-2,3-diacylglucosamine pyrophosphatase LpxH
LNPLYIYDQIDGKGRCPFRLVDPELGAHALVFDAVIISDMHLGSENCQARNLCHFLEQIGTGEIPTTRLILNGDVFDSIDFRRLKKTHWKVLSQLRKLSDRIEIIWLCGNHDGSAEIISHLLGVQVAEEFILESGDQKILILHGHVFDEFLDAHPVLTWLGDCIYLFLQKVDRWHYLAKLAKRNSKTFLRCSQIIEEKSIKYARHRKCTAVCCGHTHHAMIKTTEHISYFNSGCWTELPCTYLTVAEGKIELHAFQSIAVKVESEEREPAQPPVVDALPV